MSLPNPKIIDLSHWNAPSDLTKPAIQDWDKARSQGVIGAIIRLGSIDDITMVPYTDYRLKEFVQGATNAKIPLGYYFYARPRFSGKLQGDFIMSVLKDLPVSLDVMLDVEVPGQDIEQARDSIRAMANAIIPYFPGRVGIYSRQNLWDRYVIADPLWPTLKLWAARWYSALTSPWSDGLYKFRDWVDWKYWQYSADGNLLGATYGFPSGTVNIDLTYYNGTEDEFKKEYNLVPPDPLAELSARVLKLETLQAETNARVLKVIGDAINLQEQLDNTNINQSAILESLLELEAWARGINYKKL